MALIFFEGFETNGAAFWNDATGFDETSIVYAGSHSWGFTETTDYHIIGDTHEIWFDFYWRSTTVSANFHHIASFMATSFLIAGLRVNTSGKLTIYNGTTLIATGTTTLSSGVWYHIAIHILRDSTSGIFDVELNGNSEIDFAGDTGSNDFNRLRFGSGNAGITDYYDNISAYDAAPGAPLVADFSGTPLSGPVPLDVDFTDLSTGSVIAWDWDFGDAYSAFSQNPSHLYSSIGIFTVALTAADVTSSDTETKIDYIEVLGPPIADFSGTPLSGTAPLSVAFTDLSTNSPTAWTWDFGDGTSATTQNPTHIYNYVGVYTVTLIASSSAGIDSETKIAYITVTAVAEVGPAEIENCDIDTGGLSTGLRVADVAIARDNNLGSLVIDASAELRVKDNAYSTLTNNGTLTSLAGDRAAWDTTAFPARHARDISEATGLYHLTSATTQTYTVSNPSTDRAYDVSALTLNELAAVVGTLIADLRAKGLLD